MSDTIAKLRELLLHRSKAGMLRGLLDQEQQKSAPTWNGMLGGLAGAPSELPYKSVEMTPERIRSGLSGLVDMTPVVGDAKSAYEGVQAAREGDWAGAGLGMLGALPFVPGMAGVIAKGNFPDTLYRGTTGSTERIKGGVGEGLLFATPQERVARMYGQNIEKIGVNPDANILIEGTKEFAEATGRRRGKIINNMRKGENMKTAADSVIERAKALGFDAVDFNSMEDLGTAIINQSKFKRGQ